ncbi:hypothetical protein U1Q18_043702 [Sarracenia purpurea var. burkii]
MTLLAKIAVVFVFASSQPSEQTERPLPHRNLSWETIRAENYLYIDKTPYLIKLLETSRKLAILTRPRRFGKSIFLQMMADFFRGKEDKFEGLAIYDEGNTKYFANYISKSREILPKWMEFPVIYLNFRDMGDFNTKDEFAVKYVNRLKEIAFSYQLDPNFWQSFDLNVLIEELNQKFNLPVIILVDEYDHPLQYALLQLKNKKLAQDVKGFLHSIFTVIKNRDCVDLAFLTGVTQLGPSRMESSGFNAFTDLTFDKDFAGAFGFSESEIKDNLTPHMIKFAQNISTTQIADKVSDNSTSPEDNILEKLKFWYGGYQFTGTADACKVLNPVSTLESLMNQEFGSYGISTDSMDYFVRRFYDGGYSLDRLRKGDSAFRQYLLQNVHQSESTKVSASSQPSEQTERPLPHRNLSWETIRAENYLYIDKTPYLIKMLKSGCRLAILTRPPRFGKSVFLQMMADFFRGKEDKFEGLAIYDEGNTKYFANFISKSREILPKWMEFPVIYLNFGDMGDFNTEDELAVKYVNRLKEIAFSYQLDPDIWQSFDLNDLIEDLYRKFQLPIFILVDEYDHLFTFLTGVTQLGPSRMESSGFNAFIDLTFDKNFAGAFGFSESEIKDNLTPHMIKFAQNISTTQIADKVSDNSTSPEDNILEKLKFWYDGYQFTGTADACKVLNPFPHWKA